MNPSVNKADDERNAALRGIEAALRAHRPDMAAAQAERLSLAAPDCVEAWILLGRALQQRGAVADAVSAVQRALVLDPGQPGACLLYAELLAQAGRTAEALEALGGLAAIAHSDGRLLQHVGQLFTHLGRHADATHAYARAAELAPSNPEYLYNLATARIALGELGEAEHLLDSVIDLAPADYDAWYNRATLRKQTAGANHIAQIEHALSSPLRHPGGEVPLHYALAKEYEDLGEHEKSFAALKRGADLRRRMLSYRVDHDVATMAALQQAFTPALFARAGKGHGDARPLFILGLPRSGTTLVDRILSSHSKVVSLGERSDFALALLRLAGGTGKAELIRRATELDFATLGRAYCAAIGAGQGDDVRLIDKTPVNFLYLGLIALALPNARIVHVRRNAMDVCYAMYKTLFRMAYPFSYDLCDLAKYYLSYRRLMAHWREVLPGRIIEIEYEALVADQEGESRRLVAACGLDWEDACLAFERNASPSLTASAAQARQPIYASSVGLWQRYAEQLAPLAEMLHAGGVEVR